MFAVRTVHRLVIHPFNLALACALALGASPAAAERPVHTFSIVARDSVTGQLGVAVQSHWFSVGSVVTWAEAGVGAVATQSFAEPAYGPRGLALMNSGLDAPSALRALIAADPAQEVRQVAFVDARGRVAAHTGAKCIETAGHHVGRGWSVQANMMLGDSVVPAMAAACAAAMTAGADLPERLLRALEAAQGAGGDIRGVQSAAILVVAGTATGRPSDDRLLELRVEDSVAPLPELRRLVGVWRAYGRMNAGDAAVEQGDLAAALAHYAAADSLLPGNLEVRYWHAVTLAVNGHAERALPIFREVFAADRNWVELTRRLVRPGLIPDTATGRALLAEILREAPR
jgi:uncharacterized Ntn-hydrolase superfamily protein